MKHLEYSFTGKNNLWRYVVLIVLIFTATNTIGSLPISVISLIKSVSDPDVLSKIASDLNYLTDFGIDRNIMLMLVLFPFIVGLATYMFLIKPMHSKVFINTITSNGSIRWKRVIISGGVWMILMAVYLFVYIGFDPSNFVINNKSSSLVVLSVVSFLLIPFQAAFEEVIFRGYLMQGFTLLLPYRLFPVIVTSTLFALMHSLNPEVKEYGFLSVMPQYLTFGMIFGILTILDDGIEAALGAHAANNIFLCIMVTQDSSALQTSALYKQLSFHPWIELGGLIISGIVLIMVLKKIFRWNDFSILFSRVEQKQIDTQTP
jgi:uncharacterized protein